MKRTIVIVFLTFCILTTSMLGKYGLSQEYLMRPYAYFERLTTITDNTPWADDVEIKFNIFESTEYKDLGLELPAWERIELDGITDVVPAIREFMNNSLTYISAAVKQFISVIPNLWHNLVVLAKNSVSLVIELVTWLGRTLKNMFEMRGYLATAALALVPLDWERMQEDGVDIKMFFFGKLRDIPFAKYYGIVEEEDITPPADNTGGNSGSGFDWIIPDESNDDDFNIIYPVVPPPIDDGTVYPEPV